MFRTGLISAKYARSVCSYAVPGMFHSDLKGTATSYDIIETDQYGRVLLRTQSKYAFTDQIEQVLIILQKKASERIYFYEDICYLLFDPTEEEIDQFKQQNDWNDEINETKLSSRLIRVTFDMYLINPYDEPSWTDIIQSFCDEISIIDSQITASTRTDINSLGKELFWFKVRLKEGEDVFYWVIADKDATVKPMQISNVDEPTEGLAAFKSENNWYDKGE